AGRTGAGILGHVGLEVFVAQDAAAFVRQGLTVAADFSMLASLRAGLRERFLQSAPGRPEDIAAGMERALRTMWQRWCAGLPAESFAASVPAMTVPTSLQQPANPIMAQALQDLVQSLAQALQLAVNHQQSGQLEEAEMLYRSILQTQPNHPEANHSLGVLAVQMRQAGAGLPYLAAALEARPEQQQYWLSYIDALIQADETETAKQVLALGREHGLQGDDMEVLAGRLNEGKPGAAPSDALPQSVKPAWQAALHSGGKKAPGAKAVNALMALYGKGRLTEAEVLARSLTTRFPHHGFGWKMLGILIRAQGGLEKALLPMQTAAELWPDDVETHLNLGMIFAALGRLAEAEASQRLALEVAPTYAEAHLALGAILKEQGQILEAEVHCRRALEIKPLLIDAHNELGIVLKNLGRLADAEASYRRALEIAPAYFSGHNNLGILLSEQNRQIEAEATFRRALQIRPDDAILYSSLLFSISQNEAVDAAALFAEHCRFGAQFEA
ncbi:Tetratricopeptide repeat-containing protein, partial [Polaromonas sp. OV174]